MKELALWIDIEGYGCTFDKGGKELFIELTNDLFSLGRSQFNYLSIIQFGGDGFLIKEILVYQNLISRFIDLSATLLQVLVIRGGVGQAKISHGDMSDVSGLYSDEIQQEIHSNNNNILGGSNHNLMIINTVIGTAMLKSYKLKGPSGPLLLVDKELKGMLDSECIPYETYDKVLSVNWLKHRNENTERYLQQLKLRSENIEEKFIEYINKNNIDKPEWQANAWRLLGKL